jgi:hypothetical protein
MAFLGTGPDYNPGRVGFGPQSNLTMPYVNPNGKQQQPNGIYFGNFGNSGNFSGAPAQLTVPSDGGAPPAQQPSTGTLGAESVRATGSGPFDPTYRQNLATFAGGQFARPGGNLSFDPTGQLFGNPTGGGNAPLQGMPDSLVGQALSGNPFSFTPPTPAPQISDPLKFWQGQFLDDGTLFGGFGGGRFKSVM